MEALDDDAKLDVLLTGAPDEPISFNEEATLADRITLELPLWRPQEREGFFLSSGLDAMADSERTERSSASLSSAVPGSCSVSE